jgi:hypothetical protein
MKKFLLPLCHSPDGFTSQAGRRRLQAILTAASDATGANNTKQNSSERKENRNPPETSHAKGSLALTQKVHDCVVRTAPCR